MTAYEASSSSSFKSKLWNYDVFLSFSGEDTRKGFTGHLYHAIEDRGYKAYMDEDDLRRGEDIKEELYRGIEESMISIIVFSKKYVDSSWCLDELVKIMECRSKLGRHVLPIFYHVDPSHVRKQDGDLAEAFQKHEEGISEEKDDKKREAKQERVKQWREALTKAANLSGHHLQITDNRREAKLIRGIVDKIITKWLPSTNKLCVAKHQVGINSRIQNIIAFLSSGGPNDVIMVGIWGMGGLGKATVAKAIYNQIHCKFEFKSFLADVSDTTSKHGLVYLQEKLVSNILKKKSEISSVDEGISLIERHFQRRRVLVIVDNIDEVEQLNAIAGNRDWYGPGSRIIITTRDEHLLKQVEVDKIYLLQKMNEEEALELFSWHAFRNSWPNKGYFELAKKVVSYCGGLPLALEVLGSFLIKRTISEWGSQLEKLEKIPDGKIIKPLRISFEGLDDTQKAIFLDISCFFIGWNKDYVIKVLDGCEFSATIGISVLRERCLVTVERNELNMHDLLREMARVIISEKSPDHPGKWSRLWNPQVVTNVLTNKTGTEGVEGLALPRTSCFTTVAFNNMKKLRLLQLNFVELNGEYKHLPNELIWLCWHGFPLKSIPDDFINQPRLVVLDTQFSQLVQVWEGSKSLLKLKIINLSYSRSLIKSPEFSQLPNLEELILECCFSLSEIHPSISHLERLSLVNLTRCYKLRSLPRDFYKSKSVETLLLNGCLEFIELHEDLGEMVSLRVLEAENTAIRQVPPSMVRLKNLTRLSLECVQLLGMPIDLSLSLHGLHSLRELNLSACHLRDYAIPKDLGSLISLQDLNLRGNDFLRLPSLTGLSKLETLRLSGCRKLQTIPDLPTNLKFLYAFDCPALGIVPKFSEMANVRQLNVSDSTKLTKVVGLGKSLNTMTWIDMKRCTNLTAEFRKNILQGWTSCGFGGIFLHGNYVPDWFEFVNKGNKVSFVIRPSNERDLEGLTLFCNFERLTLFCFYCSGNRFNRPLPLASITIINNTKCTELGDCIVREDWEGLIDNKPAHYIWQGRLSNHKLNLQGKDKVEVDIIFAESDFPQTVKRTGVNPAWDKPMKENMHDLDQDGYPHPARFYDHDPLGLAHLRPSLSVDTLPAGRRIEPRLRQTHSLQPHSQPQTRHENLPVLFQPRGPAVSDSREQISDSMGAYDPSSNQIMSSTGGQLAVAVHDHDLLGLAHLHHSLSLDTPHAGRRIRRFSRRPHSQPRSCPQNLPVLLQRQPQGPAVSDSREQISDPMGAYDPSSNQIMSSTEEQLAVAVHDHDPLGLAHLRLSLSLDTPHAGCHIQRRSRRPHSQPRSSPRNLPVLLERHPHGLAVSDSEEQISNSLDDDLLARLCKSFACLSLSPDHSSTFSTHIQPDA
ncbi:disease resistance protein RPV1 [Pyrus x bretschneideri]|uniref:disease resistance protein RPV1 n=1 Tax=Pyrus x bretschneideri TaxID=225117 RepID=UPI00202E8541|nr:disease resistance protein RPV1 [Pyrus x bretschneideri]XP_018506280.2 disease resistance protein RPV1 [Pyrus x bretschneideri]XP_048423226.1 disease resistance protein RPV1 [Pyrus x bretschneideri]